MIPTPIIPLEYHELLDLQVAYARKVQIATQELQDLKQVKRLIDHQIQLHKSPIGDKPTHTQPPKTQP